MYRCCWLLIFSLPMLSLCQTARAATDRYLTDEAYHALLAGGWTEDEIHQEEQAQRNRSRPYASHRAQKTLRQAKIDPRKAWLPDGTDAPLRKPAPAPVPVKGNVKGRYLTDEAYQALLADGWTEDEIRMEESAQRNRSQPYASHRAQKTLRQAKIDPREAWLPDGTQPPPRKLSTDTSNRERSARNNPQPIPAGAASGFGAKTRGGAGQKIFTVSRDGDSGSGTLRAAITAANRNGGIIRFKGPMDIEIRDSLTLTGSRITIDGLSAGNKGVTIWADRLPRSRGNLVIEGSDIIVRGLRIRNGGDGIQVRNGANHVLIDWVTVTAPGDGGIDITKGSHDITVQRCYIAGAGIPGQSGGGGAMLIKYGGTTNVSVYRNYFHNNLRRCPTAEGDGTFVDIRNNVVANSEQSHIQIRNGASANLIGNVFIGCKPTAISLAGRFHQSDNHAPSQKLPRSTSKELPAPSVETLSSKQVFRLVTSQAGAPLNDLDRAYRKCTSYQQARNIKAKRP